MYYTIIEDNILTSDKEDNLTAYYDNVLELPEDYEQDKYIAVNGELVLNEKYEEELARQEQERIALLHLTKREVFLGLYNAKKVTPDQIKAQITDPEALIEFDYATEYYRGNPLIDMVGGALGIKPEQLDKFFETNDYTYLIEPEPVLEESQENI